MNLKIKSHYYCGSTGLGKEILKTFISQGADVITCSRNLNSLKNNHRIEKTFNF